MFSRFSQNQGVNINSLLKHTLQVTGIVTGIICAIAYTNVLFGAVMLVWTVTFLLYLRGPIRKHTPLTSTPAAPAPPSREACAKLLEQQLNSTIGEKLKIVPILTQQLQSVIQQTDEAAGNLSTAFMGISRRAKAQTRSVQDVLGNITTQRSENNILLQTQSSLEEMQSNFATIKAFFDDSIMLISEIADQLSMIGGFAEKISQIATTTDILALNTAIQAANSGDAGASFKVIAIEVKKLAQDSNKSVHEITDITKKLAMKVSDIRKELVSVRERAHGIGERTNELFGKTTGALETTLKDAAAQMSTIAHEAEGLAGEISRAVVSIQFQDITRQRIEHVISPLTSLSTELVDTIKKLINREFVDSHGESAVSREALLSQYTMEAERQILQNSSYH